jgi:hypothetical protein
MSVFWCEMQCTLTEIDQHFGGMNSLYLRVYSEDRGSTILRDVGKFVQTTNHRVLVFGNRHRRERGHFRFCSML